MCYVKTGDPLIASFCILHTVRLFPTQFIRDGIVNLLIGQTS